MAISEEALLAPLGQGKDAVAAVAAALGEEAREVEGDLVFERAGLAYRPHWETGLLCSVRWPVAWGGATTVPWPRGLAGEMGDRAVRERLGAPAETPIGIDFYGGFQPMDVFDLPDVTIRVAYDEACERVAAVMLGTAASMAGEREKRADGSERKIRRAKGGPTVFSELVAGMRAKPRRAEVLPGVAALLELGPAQDLAELLRAHAEHDHGYVYLGDYSLEDGVTEDDIPAEGSNSGEWTLREDRLCIGRTGGGDLWVVAWPPVGGERAAVSLIVHDDDWIEQEDSDSLEEFFAKLEEND